jgi:hypothetical protein
METQFIKGAHGAALSAENMTSVVDFIADGKRTDVPSLVTSERSMFVEWASKLCWLIWLLLVWLLVWGWRRIPDALWRLAPLTFHADRRNKAKWCARLGYAALVWLILSTI